MLLFKFEYSSGLKNSPAIFLFFSAVAVLKPGSFGYLWQAALALISPISDTLVQSMILDGNSHYTHYDL